jgi:DNA-binding beta-propeller fold protein YncE
MREPGERSSSRCHSRSLRAWPAAVALIALLGCGSLSCDRRGENRSLGAGVDERSATSGPRLPLVRVQDIDLPGGATRFDYQDIDPALGRLVVAHMNDGAVVVIDLARGVVLEEIRDVPTARGVAVADEAGLIFVTSSPNQLVLIDHESLEVVARVETGRGPDGVGWDPVDRIVGVSDQGDGAISLIADAGRGKRTQIALGSETGNVAFDPARHWFWITVVVGSGRSDQLVAIDPVSTEIKQRIDLPGCEGAHGLRIHPDGGSAFIACEDNDQLARVTLDGDHAIAMGPTGAGPDVLSIDPKLGWLYVAAESGDLAVFDIAGSGIARVGRDHPGDHAHSVAVDPATHRTYFPLMKGPRSTPVLRVMQPTGV